MTTYADGTIDVRVNGEIQRRNFTQRAVGRGSYVGKHVTVGCWVDEPEHDPETEMIFRSVGESIPEIVRIK